VDRQAGLSEDFLHTLLSWRRSGFSARCDEPIEANDRASLERLVRHITDSDRHHRDRRPSPSLTTPSDPRSGATELIPDRLEWIRAITT